MTLVRRVHFWHSFCTISTYLPDSVLPESEKLAILAIVWRWAENNVIFRFSELAHFEIPSICSISLFMKHSCSIMLTLLPQFIKQLFIPTKINIKQHTNLQNLQNQLPILETCQSISADRSYMVLTGFGPLGIAQTHVIIRILTTCVSKFRIFFLGPNL